VGCRRLLEAAGGVPQGSAAAKGCAAGAAKECGGGCGEALNGCGEALNGCEGVAMMA